VKKSEKNIRRGNLTRKSAEKWVYPMKFCEADPIRDFIGVETKICRPCPVAPEDGTRVENRCDFKQFDLLNILIQSSNQETRMKLIDLFLFSEPHETDVLWVN